MPTAIDWSVNLRFRMAAIFRPQPSQMAGLKQRTTSVSSTAVLNVGLQEIAAFAREKYWRKRTGVPA